MECDRCHDQGEHAHETTFKCLFCECYFHQSCRRVKTCSPFRCEMCVRKINDYITKVSRDRFRQREFDNYEVATRRFATARLDEQSRFPQVRYEASDD
jgi:hypothetical protein